MRRLALLPVALLLAACGPTLDAASLADAVGPAFARLYVRAQQEVGRTDVTARRLRATAVCARGGAVTRDRGAGDDWACTVSFADTDGRPRQVRYDVTLKPTGCFAAQGPPAVVGQATLVDVEGRRRVNPVFAFDGCLAG